MALEDFEKQLAEEKEAERRRERRREREKDEHRSARSDHRHHHHRHHHRSSRHRDDHYDEEDGHRSKRSRHSRDDEEEEDGDERRRRRRERQRDNDDDGEDATESGRSHRHRHRRRSRGEADGDDRADRDGDAAEQSAPREERPALTELKRDSWMEAPSALDIDYVQPKRKEPSPPRAGTLGADFELKIHEKELNHHLRDVQNGTVDDDDDEPESGAPAEHEVDYTFGDAGSQWRMTRLKAVYRKADEAGRKVEDVALEQYDTLRDFDDAREEEIELDRRATYGKGYVGKEKPSGELFEERRKLAASKVPQSRARDDRHNYDPPPKAAATAAEQPTAPSSRVVDQTALNKMKAQLMKARLRKDPKADELEREYNAACEAFAHQPAAVIELSAMDSRMLATGPRNEVKALTSRRDASRGNVEENEDMTIADMVAEERRTRGQRGGEAYRAAARIAKDTQFANDLDYQDDHAARLARRVHQSDANLRNSAIAAHQKTQRALAACPLCHGEEGAAPPTAPVVSLGTRTFLTLCTEPALAPHACMIVPTEHHTNLLACDDDEWEEVRNFMKALTRMFHAAGSGVVFYENAAFPDRQPHAALVAVPLPPEQADAAPAFFREAMLASEDEWSQHKKVIDTLAKARAGLGKLAFRRSLVPQMPYFHVWFEMDGGAGHVVEDPRRWPRGDLFAREVFGGMLGLEPDVVKKQGRWGPGDRRRVEAFRSKWHKYDWTRVLTEGGDT